MEFKRGRAAVVVLGDIGRCPRMQYHCLSLAVQAGLEVDVVAFSGTQPHAALLNNEHIHLHLMKSQFAQHLPRSLYLLMIPFKVIFQFLVLLWVLCVRVPAPDLYLVQNPPSIPTLTVVRWACWLKKSALVIDWHNFGYTLLGLSLGPSHPLVMFYLWYEKRFGKTADGHLCVTQAMQHELAQNWQIQATVVYDRAPEFFHSASMQEKHELFSRLEREITQPLGIQDCCGHGLVVENTASYTGYAILQSNSAEAADEVGPSARRKKFQHHRRTEGKLQVPAKDVQSGNGDSNGDIKGMFHGDFLVPPVHHTLFTSHTVVEENEGDTTEILEGDLYSYCEGRPALVVSSTSWTADEDFNILLEAALMYDRRVGALLGENDLHGDLATELVTGKNYPFPRLLIVVTGKGPLRALYEERMQKLRLKRVAFRTLWVSAEDYPILLGSADIGVCLHTSSSGLDLPMKVVDMFGCGLPVCAVSYSCIGELVRDRQNGLLFSSSSELADQLMDLFKGFPNACNFLRSLRDGAEASGSAARWDGEWSEHVLPLIGKIAGTIGSSTA